MLARLVAFNINKKYILINKLLYYISESFINYTTCLVLTEFVSLTLKLINDINTIAPYTF